MVEPLEACSSLVLKTKEHISIRLSLRRGWSHWLWTVLTYPDLPVQDISGDVGSSHGLTAKHKLGFEAGGFQGQRSGVIYFFSLWPSCKNAEWIKAEQRLVRRQRPYTGIASMSALKRKRKKSTLNSGMWFIHRFFVAHLTKAQNIPLAGLQIVFAPVTYKATSLANQANVSNVALGIQQLTVLQKTNNYLKSKAPLAYENG